MTGWIACDDTTMLYRLNGAPIAVASLTPPDPTATRLAWLPAVASPHAGLLHATMDPAEWWIASIAT